jgi:hypothetical protein
MRSGTVLAVLARPVRRWEFLLGKFLGVQLMMLVFVLLMLGLNYLLAWIGGATIETAPWVLIVYPMVRYMIYSALGILLVTVMHPIVAFCIVLVMMIAAGLVAPKPGRSPSASACEPYREVIELGLSRGRNAMAIWQDLVDTSGFTGGYQSVRRFVGKLQGTASPEACAVIETAPGEERRSITAPAPWSATRKAGKYRRTRCSC